MTPQEWDNLADRLIAKYSGSDPVSIMLRASWEFVRQTPIPPEPPTEELFDKVNREEVAHMLAALEAGGFKVTASNQ